jgi:hypothetical protein
MNAMNDALLQRMGEQLKDNTTAIPIYPLYLSSMSPEFGNFKETMYSPPRSIDSRILYYKNSFVDRDRLTDSLLATLAPMRCLLARAVKPWPDSYH